MNVESWQSRLASFQLTVAPAFGWGLISLFFGTTSPPKMQFFLSRRTLLSTTTSTSLCQQLAVQTEVRGHDWVLCLWTRQTVVSLVWSSVIQCVYSVEKKVSCLSKKKKRSENEISLHSAVVAIRGGCNFQEHMEDHQKDAHDYQNDSS